MADRSGALTNCYFKYYCSSMIGFSGPKSEIRSLQYALYFQYGSHGNHGLWKNTQVRSLLRKNLLQDFQCKERLLKQFLKISSSYVFPDKIVWTARNFRIVFGCSWLKMCDRSVSSSPVPSLVLFFFLRWRAI